MKNKYKIKLIIFFLLFTVFPCSFCNSSCDKNGSTNTEYEDGAFIDSEGRLNITQYGITWIIYRENKDYTYGQFANRDWWVVGPVNIIKIIPASTSSGGRIKNGSMLNPTTVEDINSPLRYAQGFDNLCGDAAPYNADLNAGRPGGKDLSFDNALSITMGSLVSSISINAKQWPQLQTAAVLTVVSADNEPAEGDFRPPYSGTDKSIKFNKSDLKYSLLQKLPKPTSHYSPDSSENNLSIDTVAAYFERVWLDHLPAFDNQPIQPADNMPFYGREMSVNTGRAALFLHLDYTDEEKETLLVRFVQRGIDLYGITQNGGRYIWYNAGGHASGRKWAIIFAGLMLGDTGMQNIGQKSGDYLYSNGYGPGNPPPDYIHFGEDDQTFYVTTDDITWTTEPQWDPDTRNPYYKPYTASDIGTPEWAIAHTTQPYKSDQDWRAEYRGVTAVAWAGFILAARIMDAQSLWNHDVLFDYQDRYMAITASTSIDPSWRTAVNENITAEWSAKIQAWWALYPGGRQYSPFVIEMWDNYRDDY